MTTQLTLFAASLLIACGSAAQMLYPTYSDSAITHSTIEVDGVFELQATSLKREFSNTLLFGGFIDEDMKNRSFSHHGTANRFGLNANAEIRYVHGSGGFLNRDSIAWMVKAGYTVVGNLNYTTDAFGLLFYGNESYIGGTADFSNTRLDFAQFQKIGFGVVNKKDKSSVTLNVVNVQNYADGYIRKGELTQNDDASQIDLDIDGDFRYTENSTFSNGLGVAIDLDYRIRTAWGKSRTTFQVSVQNIGFAYMYNGMARYSADSTYSYSGFDFETITDDNDPFGDDFSVLDSLGIEKSIVKRVVALPGYLQVAKLVDIASEKKIQSFFGLRMYPTFSSVPQAFGGVYWKTADKIHLSGALTYGGFGNLRGGIYATLNVDRLNWMIGTEDVFGSVSKAGYGQSFVTRLLWELN
jgi:hypothetical protein